MKGPDAPVGGRPVVRWLFTDRRGGVSEGPFRWLNLSAAVGDDPERVAANRRLAVARMAADGEVASVFVARQVHGRDVVVVDGAGPEGQPGPGGWRLAGTGDALVATGPGQAVAVLVADCAPILLAHREGRAVAAVHAGWRGLAGGVVEAAVEALCRAAGSGPADLEAWVGPCIRGCCYEVGPEVAAAVSRAVGPVGMEEGLPRYLRAGEGHRFWLDVAEAAREALARCGVSAGACRVDGRCTACHPDAFFSYRRDGPRSGRMAGIIALVEG